jgi:hypothetical protein
MRIDVEGFMYSILSAFLKVLRWNMKKPEVEVGDDLEFDEFGDG